MMAQPFRLFDPASIPEPSPRQARALRRHRKARVPVAEIVDRYLRHCEITGKHGTARREACKRILGLFKDKLGQLAAEELMPYHVTDWIEANENWKASGTRNQVAVMVKACLNWAADQRRIRQHNLKNLPANYDESDRGPQLTDDVFLKLCRLASKPQELAMRVLRYTGRRIGEACAADVGHFDLDRSEWTVWIYKGTRGKKAKRPQKVELVPEVVELLRRSWRDRGDPGPDQPALVNGRGRRLNRHTVLQNLYNLKDRLGLADAPGSLHGMRHRYATAGIVNGAPPALVSHNLGHASVQTTMKFYVEVCEEKEALQAAAKLAMPREQ